MTEILATQYHMPTDGWLIINGKGERQAVTMITPTTIWDEAPGETMTEKLRWIIETGQVVPPELWK